VYQTSRRRIQKVALYASNLIEFQKFRYVGIMFWRVDGLFVRKNGSILFTPISFLVHGYIVVFVSSPDE